MALAGINVKNRAKRKYGTVAQEIQFSGFYRSSNIYKKSLAAGPCAGKRVGWPQGFVLGRKRLNGMMKIPFSCVLRYSVKSAGSMLMVQRFICLSTTSRAKA